jgi:RHS repeat-associated protein
MRAGIRSVMLITLSAILSSIAFAAPVISSLSPTLGPSGTPVTISGSGFGGTQGTSTVKFGSFTAQISSWSDASIVALVPTGFSTVQNSAAVVQVTVGGVGSNQFSYFLVTNPILYSMSPSTGPIGASVTLSGANFGATQGSSNVKFGTATAQITSWSDRTIVASAPSGISGSVNVKVTVGGIGSGTIAYTVSTNPFISRLSANSAPANTEITVYGTNFGSSQGSSTVAVNATSAIPSSWTSTAISIPVPDGATTGNIIVTVNGIASNGYAFMVTPPVHEGGVGFVQGNYSTAATCDGNGTTMEIPFPIEQTSGDLNVVFLKSQSGALQTSAVGDLNSAEMNGVRDTYQSGNGHQQMWFSPNIISGPNSIVVAWGGNCVTAPEVIIAEYKGISSTGGLLQGLDALASHSSSGSTSCSSGSMTTANANDLIVGAAFAGKVVTTPGTSFTNRVITTPAGDILEDRIVTATGSYSAGATMSASGNCIMGEMAFEELPNQAPVVSAGPNQIITLPTNSATLEGTVTDDGLPTNTLTTTWTKISGPGTVTFGNASNALTQVTFSSAGAYVLQLSANDSQSSASSTVTITVNPPPMLLSLSPTFVGPNVKGTSQVFTALLTSATTGTPISGNAVQFTVTGANATSGNATTNASGVATFSYAGSNQGTDTVQATSANTVSNQTTITWITPVQNLSTNTVLGRFFFSDGNGSFDTLPTAVPAFSQVFPTINFDPPPNTVPGNTSGVNDNTRPFTDVTTDANGNFTGTIVAQGNGYQAGVGALNQFQAVFTGTLTIAAPGNVSFNFFDDDGFVFGVGNGATRVSGVMFFPPPSGLTAFNSFPVMGAYQAGTGDQGRSVVVNFPVAGSYPYEVDYSECCSAGLSMTMAIVQNTSTIGAPSTGSLKLTPLNPPSITVGQTQTISVQANDGAGAPVPNASISLLMNGTNRQLFTPNPTITTNSAGQATFQYTGVNIGTDSIQAVSDISGMAAISNTVNVLWNPPTGGGGCSTYIFTPQGWIASPAIGLIAQGQIPVTLASGVTLTSGTLKFFPTSNPSQVTVLNSNTTGTGTLGTFDATLLENGQYTIQLQATQSTGACQLNETVVTVTGEYKPGREVVTTTDFTVPLAGLPIEITRTYDSLNRGAVEDFGNGWKLGASVELSVDQLMNVTFTWNGKRQTFYFAPQSAGSALFSWLVLPHYTPQPGLFGTLTSNGCSALIYTGGALVQDALGIACFPAGSYQPTVYTYTDPVGRAFTMSSTGQLQSIKDLNGNILTFTSAGISSSVNGIVVPFVRDSQNGNRITKITDLNGKDYVYGYDTSGNLSTVTFPTLTQPATYTYFTDHSLKTQVDPNGNTTTNAYYPDGRLQNVTGPSVTGPDGNPTNYLTQYAYNLTTKTTTVTNPDNGTVATTYDGFGKPLTVVEQVNATTSRTTTYQYDSKENLTSMVDACGNGTCGDMTGSNHTTVYTYDSNGYQTSVTDPLLHKSTKTYNQFGGVTSQTDAANTNTQTTTYDTNFNPQQTVDLLNGANTFVGSWTYDSLGNVLTVTDANKKVTTYGYYPSGAISQVIDALNETTQFHYDAMNRPSDRIDPLGHKTLYGYDDLGRLKTITDPIGGVTQIGYDNNGNKASQTDANNNQTTYQYDALNRLTKVTYPTVPPTTKQFTYDFRNNKLTETDQSGHITKYGYDLAGQLTSVTYGYGTADAGTISYAYDLDGRIFTTTDELNNVTTNGYDVAGRLLTVTDALTHATTYGYDADNRRSSIKDANQNITSYGFDPRGRLTTVTYPVVPPATQPTTTIYTYDGVGRTLTTTDQSGKVTTKTYDDVGRLATVQDAMVPSDITRYNYDLNGNLKQITDAAGRITTYGYDELNRLGSRALPIGMSETYTYDHVGNMLTKIDFNNFTTTYGYDQINRLLSKTPQTGTGITFAPTPTGKVGAMTDPSGSTTLTYDNRDRLKTKQTPEGTLNYTYDAHSNLKTILSSNANGGSVTYTYDAANRLKTVADNRLQAQGASAYTTTYDNYDPVGNLLQYTLPNGVVTTSTFDPLNRLATTSSAKGSALSSFTYARFPEGNVNMLTELNGRHVTYGYDNIYRLTSEAITGDPGGNNGTVTYPQYDKVGNRSQRTSTLGAVPPASYTYDANDRLTTDTYDNNGNTIFSGGIAFTYDFENRLLSRGGATIVYDGEGNRVSETAAGVTTKYLVDTLNPTGYSQVVDELVNGSVTRTYAYGLSRVSEDQLVGSTWTPSFYGYDGHGNARFLANGAGTITDTYQFDAFGAQIASSGTTPNPYLYSGELFDNNLSLYHLRARYYNVLTGRFETMDPVSGKLRDPATLHRYVYTANNPVNRIDPQGTDYFDYESLVFRVAHWVRYQRPVAATAIAACIAYGITGLELLGFEGWPGDLQDAQIAAVEAHCTASILRLN